MPMTTRISPPCADCCQAAEQQVSACIMAQRILYSDVKICPRQHGKVPEQASRPALVVIIPGPIHGSNLTWRRRISAGTVPDALFCYLFLAEPHSRECIRPIRETKA